MVTSVGKKKPQSSVETTGLRIALQQAYKTPFGDQGKNIGSFRWGIYAFFDYDGEPIYVGQTYEGLSSRIGRHLTNQRTDAVAMSVLDPFEVCKIRMYPLPDYNDIRRKHPEFEEAKAHLNALELAVYNDCIVSSHFGAILNEQDPAKVEESISIPAFVECTVVSEEVSEFRGHPDVRIARRAQTIARLAQVISERQVSVGLRRALLTQAKRLQYLAEIQLAAYGGELAVPKKRASDSENKDDGGDDG